MSGRSTVRRVWLFLSLAHATALLADPPATDRWQLDLSPGRCTLSRAITTPKPVSLSLDTVPGSDSYRLTLTGSDLPRHASGGLFPVSLVFHDADARLDRPAVAGRTDTGDMIRLSGLDRTGLADFAGASSLTLSTRSGDTGSLSLPGAAKAAAAFVKCEVDQLVAWGADPAQFMPGGARPVALVDRDDWVSDSALRSVTFAGSELVALLRVTVAIDGHIDGCARIDDGGESNVEAIACRAVIGKLLFTPAHEAGGQPVRGVATFAVRLFRQAR